MNDTEFSLLKEFFEEKYGLSLRNFTRASLSKKLGPRLKSLRLKSFSDYYTHLSNHQSAPDELSTLPSSFINMESYFLREKAQFNLFIDLVKKIRIEKIKENRNSISILSAGCSSGEEPYSILMLIRKSGLLTGWEIRICGIDVDPAALEKAKKGIYRAYSLRGVEEELLEEFFQTLHKNTYRINKDMIKSIDFIQGNILDPAVMNSLKPFDFIFCRNVLIYMSRKATNRIALNLWEALSDTGYLILGQSESFIKQNFLFRSVTFPEAIVYQKKHPQLLMTESE